jgi:hypothetical protein
MTLLLGDIACLQAWVVSDESLEPKAVSSLRVPSGPDEHWAQGLPL